MDTISFKESFYIILGFSSSLFGLCTAVVIAYLRVKFSGVEERIENSAKTSAQSISILRDEIRNNARDRVEAIKEVKEDISDAKEHCSQRFFECNKLFGGRRSYDKSK